MAKRDRTKANRWHLKTPPESTSYTTHVDQNDGVKVLARAVGQTVLLYDPRCINDLHVMLKAAKDWLDLGGTTSRNQRRKRPLSLGGVRWTIPSKAGPESM